MLIRWASLLVLAVVLTACADEPSARPDPPRDTATPSEPGSDGPRASPERSAERLEIRASGVRLVATLRDTSAARDLRAQLPARLTMRDHGAVEKTGALQRALTVQIDGVRRPGDQLAVRLCGR